MLLELDAQEAKHDNQQSLSMKLQKNHHVNNMKGNLTISAVKTL
jgi:hypothetical protein